MYKQVDFNRVIEYDRRGLKEDALLDLYKAILKPRMIEEKMLSLLRQGKISKWFAGIGQEAIAVGSAEALEQDEYMLTMHRNLGVFTSRKVPLERLFAQFQGKKTGFTKGRDRSFHFGSNEHKIVGMISHLGPQLGVADGLALAHKLKKEQKVTLVFTGDGGTSEGDFHEALNVAAVWNLPVIFLIENNGYGLSTPNEEQFVAEHLIDKAIGYGMKGKRIDGNNLLEVYHTVKDLAGDMRKDPKPVILECMTFRMRGHEEASGTKYVPEKLMEEWAKKDPVLNYETFLKEEKHLDDKKIEDIRAEIKEEIENALKKVYAEDKIKADMSLELSDVYRPSNYGSPIEAIAEKGKKSKKKFINAITDALDMAMMKFQSMILMGQDIAEYGGVFKVTKGLVEKYGRDRVRNTPLCESAIIGTGLGLSIRGIKSVVEMQFADFVSSGFTQTVNNLAKIHYRWDQNADVVIRMPTGAGVSAGPFHSQSDEAWFYHTPGLKVVYPSNPEDAKGLLLAAIEDPNPVMYFEHKVMYRSITGEVPDDYYTIEIGKAKLVKEGDGITIITYGMGVHWALETLADNPDISADLIDLRTLVPLDFNAIKKSVKKTGKVIILHEDVQTGGIGGDISALISQHLFEYLDAPVIRSAAIDTPVPFTETLESNFLPRERFKKQLRKLWEY